MKAILVMDMPNDCAECQFCGRGGRNLEKYVCCLTREHSEEPHLVGCPLKPIPKELVYEGYDSPNEQIGEAILRSEWGKKAKKNDAICIRSFSIGYNSCLEEITK